MSINVQQIKRFASGKFSFNDYLFTASCFKKQECSGQLQDFLEKDWDQTPGSDEQKESLSNLLDRIHHQINLNGTEQRKAGGAFYRTFSRIASVLLIPAFVTIAILVYLSVNPVEKNEMWAEIHSPIGSRTKFQLPDGTVGWLNSGSYIKYPVNFVKTRAVEISGEAYFEVVHLKSKDFRVITPFFDVKVLGTRFNVIAYDNESTAEVILENGKVQVLGKDNVLKGVLSPDQRIIYDKASDETMITSIDSKSYTSWKDGLLVFRNVPMSEIARRLERIYNTEIILHGDSLKSSIFRATFQNENLDEICKMLATVAPIRYKICKREKLDSNAFEKGRVEMWLK